MFIVQNNKFRGYKTKFSFYIVLYIAVNNCKYYFINSNSNFTKMKKSFKEEAMPLIIY